MKTDLPEFAAAIIKRLKLRGYDAYAAGGCIRDILYGKTPEETDIFTNAPITEASKMLVSCKTTSNGAGESIAESLFEEKVIRIHALNAASSLEDAVYSRFSRDSFTCDTILTDGDHITDRECGVSDIKDKRIRFAEKADPLCREYPESMLRVLSYASKYGALPDSDCDAAIRRRCELIERIPCETVFRRFCEILTGDHASDVIRRYVDIISVIVPQIKDTVGFEQHSKYHCYDVFEHTLKAISSSDSDVIVRLALFFHDIGKPYTYTFDGISGHFKGHNKKSAEIARKILFDLRADRSVVNSVSTLVYVHDMKSAPTLQNACKLIARYGFSNAKRLIQIQRADIMAHHPDYADTTVFEKTDKLLDEALSGNMCISVRQLSVKSHDLDKNRSMKRKELSDIMQKLLFAVIDGEVDNEKDALLRYADKKLKIRI